jgi:beta-lactamase regulating signal transducer with metallopeptidase domain
MTEAAFNLQFLAQFSSERILNCAVEGLGIAVLAWILLRVIGRQNSGTRFAVWFSALLGIAALPLFGKLASSGTELTRQSEITMPASWALYIFAGWALVAAAGLVRVGIGFWHLHRLRKTCIPLDVATLDPLLRKTLEEFDSPRTVAACVSNQLRVPTAIGFVRPLVVLPSWTMQELSATELNAILLHELAHLRRWDDWTNLVQKVLGALFFFHPAVWWIEKNLALEREMACDDLVLARTASPRVYAECLVSLAEKSLLRRGLTLAQAAVNRMRQVSLRVSQILDVNRPSATRVWRPAPVLLTGVSVVCLMAFSNTPRLVSFQDGYAKDGYARDGYAKDGSATSLTASTEAPVAPGNIEASAALPMSPRVIPARVELKPGAASLSAMVAKTNTRTETNQPALDPAKAQTRTVAPTFVRASVANHAVTVRTLVFIVETPALHSMPDDASGAVVWHLSVWEVTVVRPAKRQAEPGVIAKST